MLFIAANSFVLLNSEFSSPDERAELESPQIERMEPLCLTFFYYMNGAGVESLEVIRYVSNILMRKISLRIVTLRHELGRVPPQAKPRESPKCQVGSKFLILGFCLIWSQIGPIYHISKELA